MTEFRYKTRVVPEEEAGQEELAVGEEDLEGLLLGRALGDLGDGRERGQAEEDEGRAERGREDTLDVVVDVHRIHSSL